MSYSARSSNDSSKNSAGKKLADILHKHDRDRSEQQPVRDERIPDLTFARWSQNDDEMSTVCTTEFLGEFNIISRERKNIQAEFRQNEIEVKFRHKKDDNDDLDKFVQGKYRTDRRLSKSRQCFTIAQDDVIDCGFGAWRLYTEDTDNEDELDTRQEIRRAPIPEAIRTVFFDTGSKLSDKSDAQWCSVITSYNEDAYKQFLEDNDIDAGFLSFEGPYQSIYELYFPGNALQYPLYSTGQREINLLEFYQLEPEEVTYWLYLGVDENGREKINSIKESEAKEAGFPKPFRKKKIKVDKCMKYITNGVEILLESEVPGGNIPIIPMYGERNFVNGTENFYGIVKAAKDPQKLINAAYNYLASLMMFSPVPKPVYDPREIEGLEEDHLDANNHELAYIRKNKTYVKEDGSEVGFNPEYTQPAQMPPAVAAIISQLPAMTDSILNPGMTEDVFSSSLSGEALQQIKEMTGIMTYIFLDNWNESMRRDGEIYAAMLSETTDVTTSVVVTNSDGTTTTEFANEQFFNVETMSIDIRNPIMGAKFNVYSDVGPSYQSQRDAALSNLKELFQSLPPGDPMQRIVMLAILSKQDGEGLEEVNKVARFELLGMGLPGIEPQTREEEEHVAMLQQQAAQQQEQPDPMVIAAMAEMEKAQAEKGKVAVQQEKNQIDMAKVQLQAQDIDQKNQLATAKTVSDIRDTQADTQKKLVEAEGVSIDNQIKMQEAANAELQRRFQLMGISELAALAGRG